MTPNLTDLPIYANAAARPVTGLTGTWGEKHGLAARCCPDGEVDAAAAALAAGLARHDPRSVAATKALLRHDWAAEADRALSRELAAVTGLRPVIDASKFARD